MALSKSNQDYLNQVLDAVKCISVSTPECMIAIKATDSTHLFCADYWADKLCMQQTEIIGKIGCMRAYDFDPDIEEQIIAEYQAVISTRSPVMTLKILQTTDGIEPYYCLKSPIINPDNQDLIALYCQGFYLSNQNYAALLHDDTPRVKQQDLPDLTKREKEVIFLFLSNLNSQAIAETLSKLENKPLSKSTIDSLFSDKLYKKFNVYSRPAFLKFVRTRLCNTSTQSY